MIVNEARQGGETEDERTRNVIIDDDGKTRGRNERLRGQMGVKTRALNEGCTIGPPADKE